MVGMIKPKKKIYYKMIKTQIMTLKPNTPPINY